MRFKLLLAVAAASAGFATAPAEAITYVSTRTIGDSSVRVTLETNGKLGALRLGDIVFFSATVSGAGATETMNASNGNLYINGVTATATQLSFDFDVDGPDRGVLIFPDNSGSTPESNFWGFEGSPATIFGYPRQEFVVFTGGVRRTVERSGVQVIAAVQGVGGVPEPATWAMMIGGIALTGGTLRRRRARVAFA